MSNLLLFYHRHFIKYFKLIYDIWNFVFIKLNLKPSLNKYESLINCDGFKISVKSINKLLEFIFDHNSIKCDSSYKYVY